MHTISLIIPCYNEVSNFQKGVLDKIGNYVRDDERFIEVLIVDDGAGVDPSQSRSSGIANMQRRAANHGGSFAVGAGPRGRGTSLVWRSPLE